MGRFTAFVLLGGLAPQQAPARLPPSAAAPPARQLEVGPLRDLGTFETFYAPGDTDFLVARRGPQWFRVPAGDGTAPLPWFTSAELQHAHVVGHVSSGDALWLVGEAPDHAPFALEPAQGKRLDFVVSGLEPAGPAPRVQWVLALPHLGAVLLMLESGDQANWPRPGNRPLYFWGGLANEEIVALPAGYDLQYFSADRRVAVFGGSGPKSRQTLPAVALDLATGERLESVPARNAARSEFDWTNRDGVVPFTAAMDDVHADHVGGVSAAGRAWPLQLESASRFGATAKAFDAWVALRVFDGEQAVDYSSLWFGPLRDDARPLLLGRRVESYEVLGSGRCAFVVREPGPRLARADTSHAFVYDAGRGRVSDLLEGVERLPPLAQELRENPGVSDEMTIELLGSSGPAGHSRLALAWCRHERGDMRSRILATQELLPTTSWQRLVLVTATGERRVADAPIELEPHSLRAVCLFATGRLVLRRELGPESVQLSAIRLRLPE